MCCRWAAARRARSASGAGRPASAPEEPQSGGVVPFRRLQVDRHRRTRPKAARPAPRAQIARGRVGVDLRIRARRGDHLEFADMIGAKANVRTRGLRAVSRPETVPARARTPCGGQHLSPARAAPTRAVRASGSIDTRASAGTTKIVPTRRPVRCARWPAQRPGVRCGPPAGRGGHVEASAAKTTISGASRRRRVSKAAAG